MNLSTIPHLQSLFLSLLSQILSGAPGLRLLPFICTHQMSRGQHVTYHRRGDILSTRPGPKLELSVERIDPEVVPMLVIIGRRTRTSVADALKIILSLDRAIGESLRRRYSLRQFSDRRRKIEENPMRERTGRRVGVFTNQRETLRVWWDVAPPQVRREVITVAGVF
jgi:hypothetical protein